MNGNVRKITEGAMMLAILGAGMFLNQISAGFFGTTFFFLFPLPIVFYGAQYGWKYGFSLFMAAGILGFIISGPANALEMLGFVLIGLVYGCGVYKQKSSIRLLVEAMIVSSIINVLEMYVFASFFGYDLMDNIQQMRTLFDGAEQFGINVPANMRTTSFLTTVFICAAIVTGILEAITTHILSKFLLERLRIAKVRTIPFEEVYPYKWSGYIALGLVIVTALLTNRTIEGAIWLNIVNALGMVSVCYLGVFGIEAIVLTIKERGQRSVLTSLWVILLLFIPMALVLLGFLYITTGFHDRLIEKGDEERA